ncbi:MAG: hypothetical protein GTO02_16225 [Candidatus Dadabacteria bacterium]|nr:hypothetical protein [Candidatus Dadabacteria bacterium]
MRVKKLTISAVGDICPGEHPLCIGFGMKSKVEKEGEEFIFRNVKKLFEKSDIVLGNLEGVISDSGFKDGDINSMIFRGTPNFVGSLKFAGFNVMNIANNHILQHGDEAFYDSIKLLKTNGIGIVGLKCQDNSFLCEPFIIDKNDMKIGLLGYSFLRDHYFAKDALYAVANDEAIFYDIRKLKKEVDLLVVSCHWGTELMRYPSSKERRIAKQMVDEGVDIIFGHHPHVIQPIEKYKNSLIFYSLGNFAVDFIWLPSYRVSVVAKIIVYDSLEIDYELTFIEINKDYQPSLIDTEGLGYLDKIVSLQNSKLCNPKFKEEDGKLDNYYIKEALKLERENTRAKILYFLKNMHRTKPIVFKYILNKLL